MTSRRRLLGQAAICWCVLLSLVPGGELTVTSALSRGQRRDDCCSPLLVVAAHAKTGELGARVQSGRRESSRQGYSVGRNTVPFFLWTRTTIGVLYLLLAKIVLFMIDGAPLPRMYPILRVTTINTINSIVGIPLLFP